MKLETFTRASALKITRTAPDALSTNSVPDCCAKRRLGEYEGFMHSSLFSALTLTKN
jgi:hypothetical protein